MAMLARLHAICQKVEECVYQGILLDMEKISNQIVLLSFDLIILI